MNFEKLQELNYKIQYEIASDEEKFEYIFMLYLYGKISKNEYKDFLNGKNRESLMKNALLIGGFCLYIRTIAKEINEKQKQKQN
jgi:hypothetical protein